jgi:5-hydroxyisourate hydrolase-like protein (transthyretin family)
MMCDAGFLRVWALFLTTFVVSTSPLNAGTISGIVLGSHRFAQTTYPAREMEVTLYKTVDAGSFTEIARTYTGADGRYYFDGISLGQYIIQVRGYNYPIIVREERQELDPVVVMLDR